MTNFKKVDPIQIFLHADGFFKATEALSAPNFSKDPRFALEIAQPVMVLMALNIELFLKCLICIETGYAPRGHHFDWLFKKLSAESQKEITAIWDNEIVPFRKGMFDLLERSDAKSRHIPRDLPTALKLGSEAFEKIRYAYERNNDGLVFYVQDLSRAIARVILRRKPEWSRVSRSMHQIAENHQPIPPRPIP